MIDIFNLIDQKSKETKILEKMEKVILSKMSKI